MVKSISFNKKVIAITGKGGVGKTALTAMMVKKLVESRRDLKILAIDGDPVMGLSTALGIEAKKTIGEARETLINSARDNKKQGKPQITGMLDYLILETLTERHGFSMLAMGRTETLGCFCPVNDLLRSAIEKLSKSFDIVLIDCEAGLEQINRKVVRTVDQLVIVTDPTLRGIQASNMIIKMTYEYNILPHGEISLVLNKVTGQGTRIMQLAEKIGVKIVGLIPQDETITEYDLVGKPLIEIPDSSPGFIATGKVLDAIFDEPVQFVSEATAKT
jgi:CO dehydrogenase maturation factor